MKLYEPRFWRWIAWWRSQPPQPPTFYSQPPLIIDPDAFLREEQGIPGTIEEDTREAIIDHVTRNLDEVTVSGYVEGTFVTTLCWYSHLEQLADIEAQRDYLRSILREKVPIHERLYHLEDHEST